MQQIQVNALVRDRGQITLPEAIRRLMTWTSPQSVVTISTTKADEIVITPYTTSQTSQEKVWEAIKKARAIKGRGGNLSGFIAKDRLAHF